MKKHIHTLLFLTLGALVSYFCLELAKHNPQQIQLWYTDTIYTYISTILNKTTSFFSFSIGDVGYMCVVTILLYKGFKLLKTPKSWREKLVILTLKTTQVALSFFIAFNLLWALNSYKTPLHKQLQIPLGYSNEQLYALTQRIIKQANKQHLDLSGDSLVKFQTKTSKQQILEQTHSAIESLSLQSGLFTYRTTTLKFSLLSTPLTYMGFSGYLNPFSNEAQVNALLPQTTLIVTASHEVAHQLGYALESEANFIGFLAAKKHSVLEHQYAANIFALRYCLGQLNKNEPAYFDTLAQTIHPGVIANITETTEFWASYQNITDSFFKLFYSTLLKANNQKQGLASYNRFVDILVGYDQRYTLYP